MIQKTLLPAWLLAGCLSFSLMGCGSKEKGPAGVREDKAAKQLLQGIWLNDDDESVAFRVKGDSIFYPDSTVQPMYFFIESDTLIMRGSQEVKYPIVKQAAHLFVFKNQNGDVLKLSKTDDKSYQKQFTGGPAVVLNQRQLIRRDSVVTLGEQKYHVYVQVNPTSYKVLRTAYTEEGVAVDNVYYDNIVNLNIYRGASKLFSRDFRKQDFARKVPASFLSQSILSDMVFAGIDASGIRHTAVIAMPGSSMSYQVEVVVGLDGKMSIR